MARAKYRCEPGENRDRDIKISWANYQLLELLDLHQTFVFNFDRCTAEFFPHLKPNSIRFLRKFSPFENKKAHLRRNNLDWKYETLQIKRSV